ncbi:ABC transporter ATP-binding protein [Actinoplanes couchii]|uniref:ABC transporter ATP-binding protein n=1 Tax=Actinoplanes couchii TaxID=403638 RepID=A0ABQ3XL00_9ACTN|nr:ABC transporter ATP-binding protein [Actinoplanes couchii]
MYGGRRAVDDLTFTVQPGRVTGFLGRNGAGKSTTMRMILGLDRPTGGQSRVAGRPYTRLNNPLGTVGSLLEARAVHGGRSAYHHLLFLARSNGLSRRRPAEVLEMAGLSDVAHRRVRTFSLGMHQRLGLAAALLGDPPILILDEPVNGLDTDGIRWIRALVTGLAAQGRTILLSSHLMTEMEQTADHLIVIAGGRLVADTGMRALIAEHSRGHVRARSPHPDRLAATVESAGAAVVPAADGTLRITGLSPATIGDLAAEHTIPLYELTPCDETLEAVYTRLTSDAAAGDPATADPRQAVSAEVVR